MNKKIYLIAGVYLFAAVFFVIGAIQRVDATNTTCPSPVNPNTNLFIYSDSNFSGSCWYLSVPSSGSASYDLTQIVGPSQQNNWNDVVSSLTVPAGYTATLYKDVSGGNGAGSSQDFTGSVAYVGNPFNDQASFIRITSGNPPPSCPSGQIMCGTSCQSPQQGPCPEGQSIDTCTGACSATGSGSGGSGSGGGGTSQASYGGVDNPIGTESLNAIISNLSLWLYIFSIPLLSLMLLYGAFLIVTSRGEEEKYAQGKKVIKWGIIGFILVGLSGAIAAIVRSVVG